jgi:hypothetical protein
MSENSGSIRFTKPQVKAKPQNTIANPLKLTYIDGKYKVNKPGDQDGEYVSKEVALALLEALKKAQRLITMSGTEVQREEILRYLSGGYKEAVEAACFNDALGIDEAINAAEAE